MKHLNPRQGITTQVEPTNFFIGDLKRVKHLNPRQGITTLRFSDKTIRSSSNLSVKHLNPRQGITTHIWRYRVPLDHIGVKHLNPRQGITT